MRSKQGSRKHRIIGWLVSLVGILLVGLVGSAMYILTSQPKGPRLSLPKGQIALTSKQGQRFLQESRYKAGYPALSRMLETQTRPAYCGVASSVTVLNALKGQQLKQSTFFHQEAQNVLSSFWVTLRGMTLLELGGLLKSHNVAVDVHYASTSTFLKFREMARVALSKPNSFVVATYSRKSLHQKGVGHISPVAAYHTKSDRFLVVDVATYKYPPHWLKAKDLWNAINTIDSSVGKSRGFVLISQKSK